MSIASFPALYRETESKFPPRISLATLDRYVSYMQACTLNTCMRHRKRTIKTKSLGARTSGVRLCGAVGHVDFDIVGLDTAGRASTLGAAHPLLQRGTHVNGTVRPRGAMLVPAAERAGRLTGHLVLGGSNEATEGAECGEDARDMHFFFG